MTDHQPIIDLMRKVREEEGIKRVFIALTQIASCRRLPFILCFDQVDNLEPEQVGALARFLHALLDRVRNLGLSLIEVRRSRE